MKSLKVSCSGGIVSIVKHMALLIILVALSVITVAPNVAQAESFRLTLGSAWPAVPGSPLAVVKNFFAAEVKKRVEAETDHKINWVPAFGTLTKPGEDLEAIQDGVLDVGLVSPPFEPTKLFLLTYQYCLPFLPVDPAQAARIGQKVFEEAPFLLQIFEKNYNQKPLPAYMTAGSYQLITQFPVKKLSDFKGKKIAGAGPNLVWIKALGAIAVQSALPEAYTSLQTGVYEGWIMTIPAIKGFKLYDVAKYITYGDLGNLLGFIITVNLDRWKQLPEQVQEIITQVSQEVTIENRKVEIATINAATEAMKKSGVHFNQLPFEEKVCWANNMPDFPEKFIEEAGKKGLADEARAILKAYVAECQKEGYKFPRQWVKP